MSLIKAATDYLNSGKNPVITLDQLPHAIAKSIQWDPATEFNEDHQCVFLGPLQKKLVEKLLGDWLRDSGWMAMLINAEVTTSGRAEAILKGTHVTRRRYAHQAKSCHFQFCEGKLTSNTQKTTERITMKSNHLKPGVTKKKNCRISSSG